MKIITAPHPTLRAVAEPVGQLDKKLLKNLKDLGVTLTNKKDPPGVGLAAPQVAISRRYFATYLPLREDGPAQLRMIINPQITATSKQMVFGPKKDEQRLEGCLSIPHLYGPVPRWDWIEFSFQEVEQAVLVERRERFHDFAARVMQHEYDHLEGVLFTDYALKYDLPVYQEVAGSDQLEEIDKEVLELL